jgi:hypothetical protein
MSDTLDDLMEKNLIEVFGQRDFARREAAIAEIYTADCTFLRRTSGSLAATLLTQKSSAFSRKLLDSCFARRGLHS